MASWNYQWKKISKLDNQIVMGDFNIHVGDCSNTEATIFKDTMQALGLQQHVVKTTYIKEIFLILSSQ